MSGLSAFHRLRVHGASILFLLVMSGGFHPAFAGPEKASGGRFLYAGDDDWDWASPLGAAELSKLSIYGAMHWSALDWAEEGLNDVRGVLVGSPPTVGNYLTMEWLNENRRNAAYRLESSGVGAIAKTLAAEPPPNLLIFMEDMGGGKAPDVEEIKALIAFVKKGGRLVVLDDWQRYPELLDALVDAALALSKEPPAVAEAEGGPGNPEFVSRVTALVAELGDGDFRTREAAMHGLRKLGLPGIDLADELRPDDSEIAARLARLRADLVEVPPSGAKHAAAAKRISTAVKKLELAQVPHGVDTIFVNKGGAPLRALKIAFPSLEPLPIPPFSDPSCRILLLSSTRSRPAGEPFGGIA